MKKLVLAICSLLAGCSGGVWTKPGITEAGFNQDLAQCRYEAAASASGYGTSQTRPGASGAAGQGVGEGIAQALRERELIELCLRARGYSLVPKT